MANPSHKRDTNARWTLPTFSTRATAKVAAPLAAMATLAVVVTGVVTSGSSLDDAVAGQQSSAAAASLSAVARSDAKLPDRSEQASRSGSRDRATAEETAQETAQAKKQAELKEAAEAEVEATRTAVANATDKFWTTTELNLWDGTGKSAKKVGLLESGKQVLVTGRERSGRTEVVVAKESRWVTSGYLSEKEPTSSTGTGGTCSNGTSVPGGVSANIKKVHQAVCARYPDIGSYGTFRGDGEHSQGRAIDIMVSGSRGWEIAEYVRANASALGVEYVIYSQKIWSVDRAGEGWRSMSNRGSSTANHFDHVHVTTY